MRSDTSMGPDPPSADGGASSIAHGLPADAAPGRPTVARLDPVRGTERIPSVDVLRGVALLGILVMNVYAFGLPFPAYTNPLLGGGVGPLDLGTWWATHLLAELKFMTIFSMLFGAGLVLMADRAEARGGNFGRIYYRRILWLLLFGLVHAYLLWFGDILYWYAVTGLVLYPIRLWSPRALALVGSGLMLVVVPITLLFGFVALPVMKGLAAEAIELRDAGEALTEEQEQAIDTWETFHPGDETLAEEIAVYRNGWIGQLKHRAPLVLMFQTGFMVIFGFWRIGGLMLLGMALMKLGVFSARCTKRFYLNCVLLGYGIGLPLVWLGGRGLIDSRFDPLFVNQGGLFPQYFGSLGVAMGHVGLVMLICQARVMESLTARLAAVGRMALTNYLSHTVLCTTFFYGWGLGWYGHLGRFQLMGVAFAIWIFQLIVSPLWLARFRYGPAEWAWRSLTYGRRFPLQRTGV